MKIFISWSGERSRRVAELLDVWIQCVLQAVDPWISSQDIDRGALWFTEINNQLANTSHGIICLTNENKEKPWILFEAGALAKGLSSSRVFTFLIDLTANDVKDPLAQFNHTFPEKASMYKLIMSINNSLVDNKLKPSIIGQVFETYWPQFIEGYNRIIEETKDPAPHKPVPQEEILQELLTSIRNIDKRLRHIESPATKQQPNNLVSAGLVAGKPKVVHNYITGPRTRLDEKIREMKSAGLDDKTIVQLLSQDLPENLVSSRLVYINEILKQN
jgi:hypothetical protein